jgi:hypothetical protein
VPTRFRITCACCADSWARSSGENGSSSEGVTCGVGKPAASEGKAGKLVARPRVELTEPMMLPKFAPTKSSTMLLVPVLVTTPDAVEFVMTPALSPTKPPTMLLAPVLTTAPDAVEFVMAPALSRPSRRWCCCAGAGDRTRSTGIRNDAGAISDQAAHDAIRAGAGDHTRRGRIRDGAGAISDQAAADTRRADGDVAARLRSSDGATVGDGGVD